MASNGDTHTVTRRTVIRAAGAGAGALALPDAAHGAAKSAPTAPVAIARAATYDASEVTERLRTALDQVGGLRKLVAGKTVAVKVNMVNTPAQGVKNLPSGRTYQVNFGVARALAVLLDQAGAKRIRFLESTFDTAPIEAFFKSGGWDLGALGALKAKVECEDTRHLGRHKQYARVKVPWGGSLFPAYDLNPAYVDCDVYISLAKLKNHRNAGVTLSMKNNFGITPTSLYGQAELNENSTENRGVFHNGRYRPPAGVPQELDPSSPRRPGHRVPRHTVDAVGVRPIDLAIIDGIETVSGGEGPWHELQPLAPHLLIAGRNPVCTDAIATAAMGYDPLGARATGPFIGDNHLALAAALGLGTNDPARIEVRGLALDEARFPFRWEPPARER